MDPFTRTASDIDDMASTLRQLNTREPQGAHAITAEERHEPRRYPQPQLPSSPWGQEDAKLFRVPSYGTGQRSDSPRSRPGEPKDSRSSERRPSRGLTAQPSAGAGYTLYPAQSKPPPERALPPLPPSAARQPQRAPSLASFEASDAPSLSRESTSSRTASTQDPALPLTPLSAHRPPLDNPPEQPERMAPRRPSGPQQGAQQALGSPLDVAAWKVLATKNGKGVKDPAIYYFDVSTTAATLASKHGNNLIKVWSVGSGAVQSTIKISCYTTAQARSREYFVRSHAILSEPSTLVAIAAGFGDTLEIWDWARKKKLQTIDHADRWAAVRSNMHESAWSSLVTYRGADDCLDLYAATRLPKKPFRRARTIELRHAGLPLLPKYPELAFSATSPLLVLASGPRPPRLGHPPPEHETLLAVWEINDTIPSSSSSSRDSSSTIVSSEPYRVVAPWQHAELDTALPSGLATYGSIAVSLWIPASYRAVPVPASRGGQGFNLQPVPVSSRYVLVWDFSANSTRTFRIPNATSCVSPDCRFVAYCDARGTDFGARGSLVILDATTGRQLWCWPDPDATAGESGPRRGFEQLERLAKVTELSFAADGGFLFVGDTEGNIGVYEIREMLGERRIQVRPM